MIVNRSLLMLLLSFTFLFSCKGNKEEPENNIEVESLVEQGDVGPLATYTDGNIEVVSYNFDGFKSRLQKDNDTLYVVNFWATHCKPCLEEMPYFEQLAAETAQEKVKFLLVSLDFPSKVEVQLLPFLARRKLQPEVILLNDPDFNSWIEQVDPEWSGAIPATVIYKGKNRRFYEQSFSYESLKEAVNEVHNL